MNDFLKGGKSWLCVSSPRAPSPSSGRSCLSTRSVRFLTVRAECNGACNGDGLTELRVCRMIVVEGVVEEGVGGILSEATANTAVIIRVEDVVAAMLQ
jgi:hypothetical protein